MTAHLTILLRHTAALAWTCFAITMKAEPHPKKSSSTSRPRPIPRLANRQRRRDGRRVRQPVSNPHQRRRGFQRRGFAGEQRRICFRAVTAARQTWPASTPSGSAFAARPALQIQRPHRAGFDTPIYQLASRRSAANGKNIGWRSKTLVPLTFRGRVLTDVPPLKPTIVASVGFLISDKQDGPFQLEVAWIKASSRAGR